MIGWLVLREQVISSFVRTMQLFARPWLLLDDIFAPPRMNITIIAVDTSLLIISSRSITSRWHFCSTKNRYYLHHLAKLGGIRSTRQMVKIILYWGRGSRKDEKWTKLTDHQHQYNDPFFLWDGHGHMGEKLIKCVVRSPAVVMVRLNLDLIKTWFQFEIWTHSGSESSDN